MIDAVWIKVVKSIDSFPYHMFKTISVNYTFDNIEIYKKSDLQ